MTRQRKTDSGDNPSFLQAGTPDVAQLAAADVFPSGSLEARLAAIGAEVPEQDWHRLHQAEAEAANARSLPAA